MLPFLKPKQVAGLIISKRKPDGTNEAVKSEGSENEGLVMAAEDLLRAVESKDALAVASALRSAFEIISSESPAEESPIQE